MEPEKHPKTIPGADRSNENFRLPGAGHSRENVTVQFPPMKKFIVILVGATIGIGGSFALRNMRTKAPAPVSAASDAAAKEKRDAELRRTIAWKIIAPRIEIAQEEALKAVETRTQEVRDFFLERQKRVPAYAQRVLSFRSKWELGKSKLPGADKEAHTRFLRDEFSKLVFSETELGQVVTTAATDYVRDIQAIENTLLGGCSRRLERNAGVLCRISESQNGREFPRKFLQRRKRHLGKNRRRR
jgi:hypothetical protein